MYTKLGQSEDNCLTSPRFEDDERFINGGRNLTWKLVYFFLGILAALTCGILGYMAYPNPSTPSTTSKSSTSELHCGNSATEARALGCVFDLLTNNWMPKYCSDPYTDAEYRVWVLDSDRQLGAWAYYYDEKAEHQVASEEELSDLVGKSIFTTTENHLGHCTFLARRMHRLTTGEISAVAHNSFAHTMHCTSSILKAFNATEQLISAQIGSTFDVGIVSCLVSGA
ncbi:hypothetical protein BKA67DRAFT_542193 [Truncatella angustata]|uniref:Uncharacterized protein n=1 Tax=Truncatella angustata TaxID=152316 RepID=A0A9P8RG40_9PEZI|nr:uncharacterized protein BKA67DRAFT_542193 [Truncatella angustata]KAH6645222.1 hypothetical protein BKA67DRAFT_542193 [Truncatella angustata]KAH8200220.1 hypothetical protein TruAng_005612 [Truncatella angustata]